MGILLSTATVHWAVGRGTPSEHCRTAAEMGSGYPAVNCRTAGGSGQGVFFSTLPNCSGQCARLPHLVIFQRRSHTLVHHKQCPSLARMLKAAHAAPKADPIHNQDTASPRQRPQSAASPWNLQHHPVTPPQTSHMHRPRTPVPPANRLLMQGCLPDCSGGGRGEIWGTCGEHARSPHPQPTAGHGESAPAAGLPCVF